MDSLVKFTQSISNVVIVIICFLLPAFFLTTTTDFYDFNKFVLLYVGVTILMIVSLVSLYFKHEIAIRSSSITIPAVLFAVATVVTVVVNSPNKVESLLTPQGAGGIIVITFWFLLVVGIARAKDIHWIVRAMIASGTILGLLAFLQIMGIGVNRFVPANSLFASKYWTPAGSLLTLVLYLIAILPIVIVQFERGVRAYLKKENETNTVELMMRGASMVIIVLSILVIVSQLLFTARPVILPFGASWTITLESLKNVQRALFGVGPGNYMFAFTTGKPAFMNLTPYWNVRFLTASNWYMQIIAELGLVGLAAYVMLIFGLVKKIFAYVSGLHKKVFRYDPMFLGITLSLIIIIVQQLILPSNFLQMFVFYTLLGLTSLYLTSNTFSEKSRVLAIVLSVLGSLFLVFSSYVMFRVYAAEFYMKKSVDFSTQNKAQETYNYQTAAISSNPYIDRYRVIFSQTNLALATALSNKKDISDKEKIDVITLLTQTTNEGKSAIFNNPTNVQNWENLARVYKTMVNQVKDADRWALQAYQQSINLDPLNPLLRLETGGVLYSVGRFDLASQVFQEAIRLKPDWANAYYNLALSLREQKEWQNSSVAMQRAIDLLPKDSQDKGKAQQELDQIKKNIPQQPQNGQTPAGQGTGQDLSPATTPVPPSSPSLTLPGDTSPTNVINETQNDAERLRSGQSPAPSVVPGAR